MQYMRQTALERSHGRLVDGRRLGPNCHNRLVGGRQPGLAGHGVPDVLHKMDTPEIVRGHVRSGYLPLILRQFAI